MNTNTNVPYSQLTDYELVNKDQDIRGWPVKDSAGTQLGTVRDFLVDTTQDRVTSLVLDNGKSVPATDVSLGNHFVLFGARSTTSATAGTAGTTGTAGAGERVIPVIEETLRIGKRDVNAGKVRVETQVVSRPVEETVNLREEHVSVERRPVNREVNSADLSLMQDQSVEVTARSQEAVVAKVARVVEEVVIRKDVSQRTETVRDSVKHTEVQVDDSTSYDDKPYQSHFASTYGQSGSKFADYAPAYKFGHTMRSDGRFSGRDWNQVEPNARSAWEERNPGTWENFKDAVQHAWRKVTGS